MRVSNFCGLAFAAGLTMAIENSMYPNTGSSNPFNHPYTISPTGHSSLVPPSYSSLTLARHTTSTQTHTPRVTVYTNTVDAASAGTKTIIETVTIGAVKREDPTTTTLGYNCFWYVNDVLCEFVSPQCDQDEKGITTTCSTMTITGERPCTLVDQKSWVCPWMTETTPTPSPTDASITITTSQETTTTLGTDCWYNGDELECKIYSPTTWCTDYTKTLGCVPISYAIPAGYPTCTYTDKTWNCPSGTIITPYSVPTPQITSAASKTAISTVTTVIANSQETTTMTLGYECGWSYDHQRAMCGFVDLSCYEIETCSVMSIPGQQPCTFEAFDDTLFDCPWFTETATTPPSTQTSTSTVQQSKRVAPTGFPTALPADPTTSLSNEKSGLMASFKREDASADAWHLRCGGPDPKSFTLEYPCEGKPDFVLPVNGDFCQNNCECLKDGTLWCPSPATGCTDNGEVTGFCGGDQGGQYVCKCDKHKAARNEPSGDSIGDSPLTTHQGAHPPSTFTTSTSKRSVSLSDKQSP